jgi:preprotein translocase subunit SecE
MPGYQLESFVAKEVAKENRIMQYFRETMAELRKVNWPTREEATRLTIVVVVTIFLMSIFLGVIVDSIFAFIVRSLIAQ